MTNYYYDYFFNSDEQYDYAICELIEESAYNNNLLINQEHFDILANVTYNKTINDAHIIEHPDFSTKIVNDINADIKICALKDNNVFNLENTYTDFDNIQVYGSGSSFIMNSKTYYTSLITHYLLHDLACAYNVIKQLDEYDDELFVTVVENIVIRGRYELHIKNDKVIYLDTGWYGLDDTLKELQCNNVLEFNNVIVILVPYYCTPETAIKWRIRIANFLKDNNIHCILTDSKKNELSDFNKYYVESTGYSDYEYLPNFEDALNQALNSNKDYIYVMTNEKFRAFRELLK